MKKAISRKILIIVIQYVLLLLTSCTSGNSFNGLSRTTYDIIQYDNYTDSIWVSDFWGEKIYISKKLSPTSDFNFDNLQEINLPQNKLVVSLCVLEDFAWVGLVNASGSDDAAIYKYTKSDKQLNKLSDFNVDECKIISNKSVVFWSENHILIIDINGGQKQFDVSERVYDVSQDNAGRIWVATENGSIYLQNSEGDLSLQLNENSNSKIFFDAENNLWLVNYEHVVLYRKSNLADIETILVDTNDTLYSAVQDNYGKVWLVLRKRIAVYENGQITYIDLPKDIRNIRYGGVDFINELMFISSNKGVYILHLK